MTAKHTLLPPPRHLREENRFAFVALDWVPRIQSVKALRVFVALCGHADFRLSTARGVGRKELARATGLHAADVPKALRELELLHAIDTRSESGLHSTYAILLPPEAYYRESDDVRTRAREVERLARDFMQKGGRVYFFVDQDDRKVWLNWNGAKVSASTLQAAKTTLVPFINGDSAVPWCVLHDALQSAGVLVATPTKRRVKAST